jgi:hypothetical protein
MKYVTALLLTVKIAQQSAIIPVVSLIVQPIAFPLTNQPVLPTPIMLIVAMV